MTSTPHDDDDPNPPAPILFQAPRPGPGRPPLKSMSEPPESTTPETNQSPPGESSTSQDPDWSTRSHLDDGEPEPTSGQSSGSPGNEGRDQAVTGLRGSIAAGIANATAAAHNIATDDVGRANGLYLASETEILEVSDAAARIIGRKLPATMGSRDFEDYARVGMAVLSYVGRQMRLLRDTRAARRQLRDAAVTQTAGDSAG